MNLDLQDYELYEDTFLDGLSEKNVNSPEHTHYGVQCPNCKRQYNLIHNECGDYIDYCSCPGKDLDRVYHCGHCLISFDVKSDWKISTDFLIDTNTFKKEEDKLFSDQELGLMKYNKKVENTYWQIKTCDHKLVPVTLEDGTKIHCSSVHAKNLSHHPDFGLYADYLWRPTWRNEFISWLDGSIPSDPDTALEQISEAYQIAEADKMVEIGCIGGHGRTGTILACMYLLSAKGSKRAPEAIEFVRKEYCNSAIETNVQEWYVEYADHVWFKQKLREQPKDNFGYCSVTDHLAMMLRGHTKCVVEDSCKDWDEDFERFCKATTKESDKKFFELAFNNLGDYDLVYGGIVLETDADQYPCTPIDHYAMMIKGHNNCIRLPGKCKYWEEDIKEFIEKGSMGGTSFHNISIEDEEVLEWIETYPTAEELKVQEEKSGN